MKCKGCCNDKGKKNKSLEDCEYYIGSSKQVCEFQVTNNCIIDHVQENFDKGRDITEALRKLSPLDMDMWRPS